MNTSPTATHFSPDAAQPSEISYFQCPKCHRQCKSRTWFLKHLEACFKGPSYAGPSSAIFNSTVPASGEANAGMSSINHQYQHQHYHHHAPRSTGAGDDVASLTVFEPINTSSPTSSVHSYQEVQSRRNSKLKFRTDLDGGSNDAPQDSGDCGVSPNAGPSRVSALALSAKQLYSSDVSHSGSAAAKSPYGNADDTSFRVCHLHHACSSNNVFNSPGNAGAEECSSSGIPPALSHRASVSQGSASYVGSPLALRGECGSTGLPIPYSSATPAPAPPPPASVSSTTAGHRSGNGNSSAEQITPRQHPVRQGSFRLHSDGTWTQYSATFSSSASDDDGNRGDSTNGGDAAMMIPRGDSLLASSERQSSHSLSRSNANSNSEHQHYPSHHHYRSNSNAAQLYGRDTGSLSFNTGNRNVSPAGPDTFSEQWIHERNGSVGSNRNEGVSNAGAAAVMSGASSYSQPKHHASLSMPSTSSLPREQERIVPRLMMGSGATGDNTPLDRKGSSVNLSSRAVDNNLNTGGGDRLSRSAHGSASPGTFSCMSSSVSPMFAQAMASPTLAHMSASMPSAASSSRLSGAVTPRAISFQRGRAVGSGGFGTVYQAVLSDGSLAAVKELKLENTNLKAIDREVRAMSSIPPHPNCVRYLGSRYSAHHYYIIMEYISGGSINSLRKSVGRFRESVFQRYAYMVLLGLSHLHTHGIVHRDIKGANVLLDESGCAKIVDFGCSRDLNQATTTLSGGGTPLWMAPEVCRGEPATEKSDVWAFGCLCLEMTNETGQPWNFPPNVTLQGVVYALACAKASPPIPADLSPEAQDFLQRCLKVDADERATVAQLLQHPFFDVDLMEDSDEDELLSSCPQSTVKRAAQRVRQNHIQGSRPAAAASGSDNSANGNDDEVRVGSLVPGLSIGGGRSPQSGMRNDNNIGHSSSHTSNEGDLIIVSQSTHSKSPSGPRLDHYPRSVNVGFILQAVDDDEHEGENDWNKLSKANKKNSRGQLELFELTRGTAEDPSAFSPPNKSSGGQSVIPSTSVPVNRQHTPSIGSPVNLDVEGEDEYTQMITEIITQAREAYTDEERLMTEQQRQRNDLYPSSDDDDGSFSDSSDVDSAAAAGAARGAATGQAVVKHSRQMYTVSGASSDITLTNGSYVDDDDEDFDSNDDSFGKGGPQRHKLGATWRAARNSSSPVIPVNQARPPPRDNREAEVEEEGQDTKKTLTGNAQTPPKALEVNVVATPPAHDSADDGFCTTDWVTTASRHYSAPQTPLPTHDHVDPQGLSISSRFNPLSTSLIEANGAVAAQQQAQQQSPALHRLPPRHHTPTSPPLPSSVFREAAPKETVGDTRHWMSSITTPPPKGVVAATTGGTSLTPSEPGGPGRSSSNAHRRFSPGFLPLSSSNTALAPGPNTADISHNSLSVVGHRSPQTPQPAPPLTVGGPNRQSSQGPRPSTETPAPASTNTTTATSNVRHSPNGTPVEWYTSSSGRLERNVTWQTGASAVQPKELSMAQKEMQDMLDWGSRGSDRHSSAVPLSSPGTTKHSSKESKGDVTAEGQGTHRHRHTHQREEEKPQGSAAVSKESLMCLSATEKVEGKRHHLRLGIFRSRKSK